MPTKQSPGNCPECFNGRLLRRADALLAMTGNFRRANFLLRDRRGLRSTAGARKPPCSLRRGRAGTRFLPLANEGKRGAGWRTMVGASRSRCWRNTEMRNAWRARHTPRLPAPHSTAVVLRMRAGRTAGDRVCETLPPDRASRGFLRNHRGPNRRRISDAVPGLLRYLTPHDSVPSRAGHLS